MNRNGDLGRGDAAFFEEPDPANEDSGCILVQFATATLRIVSLCHFPDSLQQINELLDRNSHVENDRSKCPGFQVVAIVDRDDDAPSV